MDHLTLPSGAFACRLLAATVDHFWHIPLPTAIFVRFCCLPMPPAASTCRLFQLLPPVAFAYPLSPADFASRFRPPSPRSTFSLHRCDPPSTLTANTSRWLHPPLAPDDFATYACRLCFLLSPSEYNHRWCLLSPLTGHLSPLHLRVSTTFCAII